MDCVFVHIANNAPPAFVSIQRASVNRLQNKTAFFQSKKQRLLHFMDKITPELFQSHAKQLLCSDRATT